MIKVFNIRDLIKYFIKFVLPIVFIFIIILNLPKKSDGDDESIESATNLNDKINKNNMVFLACLEDNLYKYINNEDENNKKIGIYAREVSLARSVMNREESGDFDNKIADNTTNKENENLDNKNNENSKEMNQGNNESFNDIENISEPVFARGDVTTEVVKSNVNPRYNREYEGVKIYNGTDYNLTDDMLNPDSVNINKKKVVIYHTHTCESYTPTEKFNYNQTGNFRTQDENFNMIRVGEELAARLRDYGIEVIHSKTFHDYPSYNGSYSRSLKTAEKIKNDNLDADIFIDLHRDAIADSTYAPKVKIGDEYASQLMFVVGSDKINKQNANWNNNLKFAVKVQKKGNELYNGLFKPIILRNSEYNGHISNACTIIEVGSTGNTLEESINSMKYLAKILSEL